MVHETAQSHKQLVLPSSVVGPTDVTRLQRQAETLDDYLRQAGLRKGGQPVELPKIPVMLDDVAAVNHLNLLHAADRQRLTEFLTQVQAKAPVVHISFAAEPSPEFIVKIILWLRQNTHALLLMQIGLQPSIAAGCVLRTTNKVFDFSLRQHFMQNRQLLTDALIKAGQQQLVSQPATQQPLTLPQPLQPRATSP